ncbi:hypothetical protein, partial [Rhizobium laguerreae]
KNYGTAVGLTIGPKELCVYDKTAHKPLKLLATSGGKSVTIFRYLPKTLAHFASACALIAKGRAIHNINICLLRIVDISCNQSRQPSRRQCASAVRTAAFRSA